MLEAMLAVIAVFPVILSTCFAVEVLTGLRPLSSRGTSSGGAPASAVVVIPAHNEESSIAETIAAIRAEAAGIADVLVVADNCSDRTAEIARAGGARTIVRGNPGARGKGYALAFARDELAKAAPAVVVIVDADCRINRTGIAALIAAAAQGHPAQAVNLLRPDLAATPFVQMSNFAFMLRNLIRQRGLQRLVGRVHLTGTGMAFPWKLFSEADLGGASIVEDLELGLVLSAQGHAPVLLEDATVWSPAASAQGTMQQRERWEGGFLASALPVGFRGLWRSVATLNGRGLIAAIDLCIPPLVLLGLLDGVVLASLGVAAIWDFGFYPFLAVLISSALAAIAVILAWVFEGRAYASPGALARIPQYALRKLPIYARLLIRGAPRDWVRTDRSQ